MHSPSITKPYKGYMLKLAKLLHYRGFHVTFVNSEFNHRRFLKSLGPNSVDDFPDFRFQTIPDGLPDSEADATIQNIPSLCDSMRKNFLAPFGNLLLKLNEAVSSNNSVGPPVTSIVSDGFMPFAITAAEELGLPIAVFFTLAAVGFMGCKQYPTLVEKGLPPPKDESYFTNGFLDKVIDWIPGEKAIRLRDLPASFQTTNPNDINFNFTLEAAVGVHKASAVVVHTFDALEPDVLDALSSMLPHIYAVGPLQLLLNQVPEDPLEAMGTKHVVYVNFGSLAVVTAQHLIEFGWGLANSKLPFFWVIRPDLVAGESVIFPPEFVAETMERGPITSWCPQEQVLNHPSVGGFLTHSGWNSTMESLSAGVPMLCCPLFGKQRTNCFYTCSEWDDVEKIVKEMIVGEKGKKMKNKAMEWKKLAEKATDPHGSSWTNLDNLVNRVLLRKG
ncbi:7-deoxyloganetin glucosyltransferase-like [Pyrus ussuriensis x Pyrus communis]|uniref:7-deoxyloganetin glucosyltransferase-like n=1 Tax=Pyrus ussuriensis x Pyrus communis TaxID=2448454 RepID=A0A5N5G5T5_9ROSA|nr:7-deoxyloganetin glucosyltransferase-like [Pyrus ussuriensis x Pyrus communis]